MNYDCFHPHAKKNKIILTMNRSLIAIILLDFITLSADRLYTKSQDNLLFFLKIGV